MTVKNKSQTFHSEAGSAIFFIMIGIALFAALSYSVANMMRSGAPETITEERSKLLASEMIDYARAMRQTVQNLRINGCGDNGLSFTQAGGDDYEHNPVAPASCRIFDSNGGGMNVQIPQNDINGEVPYVFTGLHEIQNIGTTCGTAACSDLIIAATNVSQAVCQAINQQMNITGANTAPPTDTGAASAAFLTAFDGTYGAGAVIGDEAAALSGQATACFQDTTNNQFVFYHVLKPR